VKGQTVYDCLPLLFYKGFIMSVTSEEVQAKVKVIAEQLNFTLTAEQITIITARTSDAYNMILFRLSNVGYTKAQIDSWASLDTYWSDQAVYLSLLDFLGASVNVDDTMLEKYNRLIDLEADDILLLDGDGNIIRPDDSPGGIDYGFASATIIE